MRQEEDFVEFAKAAAPQLRRTAFLLCRDWHLAQDFTQTTLAKVFVRWKRISRQDDPTAYSRKILLRVFLDHQRRRSSGEIVVEAVPERHSAAGTSTDLRLTLIGALGRVPPRDRAIVVLRYWEDMSVEAVARTLGISTAAVKTQSHRTLARLRVILGPEHAALAPLDD